MIDYCRNEFYVGDSVIYPATEGWLTTGIVMDINENSVTVISDCVGNVMKLPVEFDGQCMRVIRECNIKQ